MSSNLLRIVALALAYGAFGWAALKLAVPPGYAAPIFPSAGIALSALLIFGLRLWPGVLLGSLLVQIAAQVHTGVTLSSSVGASLVPLGATLQAIVGAALARRLIGFPNPLDAPKAILRFLGVIAPLSCLISPSISVPLLHHFGTIPSSEVTFNWWNWWLGDALGVMIAAPLMFVLFGQPAEAWRGRRMGVIIPLGLAIGLLAFVVHHVRNWEDLRIQTQFNRDIEHITSVINKRLEVQIDMMQSIERLMTVSDEVNRTEFSTFVTPWLKRYPGTQNFGWSPYITHAERADFERAISRADGLDFRILGRDAEGRTFPAPPADDYLPITYVEPINNNRTVLGLNPLSLPATAQAIHSTQVSGLPVATEGIRLVQENSEQRGVVVYLAAFDRPAEGDQTPRLSGVVSGVFRMDDSTAGARELAQRTGIEFCLVDRAGQEGNRRLSGPRNCDQYEWLARQTHGVRTIEFGGRLWDVRLRAGQAYLDGIRSWTAWGTVAIGMLAVGMLGAFLLITTGNTRRIASLVDQRTAELAAATEQLTEKQAALADAQRIARMGSWEMLFPGAPLTCSEELHQVLYHNQPLTTLEDLSTCLHETDREKLAQAIEALAQQPGHVTFDCGLADASPYTLQFQIESEWRHGQLHRIRGTVQDVTAAREAEAHIQYLAHFDGLTGLPNRGAWMKHAQAALMLAHRHGDTLGVLFLDLDHFKTVNDSLGHPVGDRLLAAVARRLSGCLREEDVLARLGGDEFVALLPRLHRPDDAAMVARKLLAAMADTVHIEGHDLSPSVSIGIALYPNDGNDVDTLLKHADTAMYGAKAAGRNNYQFFVPEMNTRAFERLMLENALRRGIERNELILHYQPQIDAASGRISGCEALVRWEHPDLGLVPPAQFIPVAEDSGLIVPLGEWVLREACRQQVRWRDSAVGNIQLAVNISALQFRRNDFVDTVARALEDTGADARYIELEITESALMQPDDHLIGRLDALCALGLTLALDDFGTGYSSLSYLKRLPISRLKIDRSFVKDLPSDAEDAAVTSATLSLAQALGLDVVAEGVETPAQRDYLVTRGCNALQGFLYSRPLAAEALEVWVGEFETIAPEALG